MCHHRDPLAWINIAHMPEKYPPEKRGDPTMETHFKIESYLSE